jgi:MFS family permease
MQDGGDKTNAVRSGWLNRNVLAFGLTSMLGDVCHEMATAVLPQFMRVIGASAASLGFIEGLSDALSNFVKLGAGFHSDKIGHRKTWTVIGYLLTAVAKTIFARNIIYTATSFPIGALSDRFHRNRYLAVGYGVAVVTFLGFAFARPSVGWFMVFFGLAGVFIAWEDTIEGVAVRDYIDASVAGTAFCVLGVVNGIGDFVSSLVVGLLWTVVGPDWRFGYSVLDEVGRFR